MGLLGIKISTAYAVYLIFPKIVRKTIGKGVNVV
jgi:hypothetical protein